MVSEKRFVNVMAMIDKHIDIVLKDTKTDFCYSATDEKLVDLINHLSEENEQLKRRLEKINEGYGLLTHRNGLTANEWVIERQEKELKKINEENEQLKAQLNKIPPKIKEIWLK